MLFLTWIYLVNISNMPYTYHITLYSNIQINDAVQIKFYSMSRKEKAMKCPKCGKELRRSKKDPNYMLCDNCRKKYKLTNNHNNEYHENYSEPKPVNPENRKAERHKNSRIKGKKLILLGVIILIFITITAVVLNSLGNTPEENKAENITSKAENENPLGFDIVFSSTYPNDTTGNWRLAKITENIAIEEHTLDYYNNYFQADNEVHIIINFTLNTTSNITVMGNLLDVTTYDYVDQEEHDAKLACSGTLLSEYHVNIDTGEIEKIQ